MDNRRMPIHNNAQPTSWQHSPDNHTRLLPDRDRTHCQASSIEMARSQSNRGGAGDSGSTSNEGNRMEATRYRPYPNIPETSSEAWSSRQSNSWTLTSFGQDDPSPDNPAATNYEVTNLLLGMNEAPSAQTQYPQLSDPSGTYMETSYPAPQIPPGFPGIPETSNFERHSPPPQQPSFEDVNRFEYPVELNQEPWSHLGLRYQQGGNQSRYSEFDSFEGSVGTIVQDPYQGRPQAGQGNLSLSTEDSVSGVSLTLSVRSQAGSSVADTLLCHCGVKFTGKYRRGNLARHQKLKHTSNAKDLQCEYPSCNKSFRRSDARLKHYRRKHGFAHDPALS